MTGAGGGALMTPMLILLFGVTPSAAISSDLVAAVVMRPIGAGVHFRRGTVNLRLVGWMVLGSVPMAFLGAYLLHVMGDSKAAQENIEVALGTALLVGAVAMVVRYVLDRRTGTSRTALVHEVVPRPLPTVAIGAIGGIIVGMTSVGSGSLLIVMLLFLYPMIGAKQLVGTDLAQAVPLTLAAALGALAFGHVEFGVTVVADHRQRAGRVRRLACLLERPGPLHPPDDHLRGRRVRAEVRGRWHDRPGLAVVRDAVCGRGRVAGLHTPGAAKMGAVEDRDRKIVPDDRGHRLPEPASVD